MQEMNAHLQPAKGKAKIAIVGEGNAGAADVE